MAINPRQIGQSVEANLIYTLSKQLNNLTISVSAGIANVLAQSMSYTDNSIAQVLIYVDGELANKQDTLVSGVNIKTVNGNTILGPGDIIVSTDAITVVANYSALPPVATVIGDFFWVENSQGTQWLPGSLGGTYYPKGMYYSNGVTYEYTETPYQASQTEVNSGTNDSKFVTPLTLTNATVITNKVVSNSNIIGNTNTKITYDSKGLVTAGTNATTIDIADSINKRYQTDNQQLFNDVTSSIQTQLNNKQNNITGTTNRLLKFISANTVGNSTITDIGGNIGIGSVTSPGELLHIGDGNILLEGGNEVAQKFKRDFTTTGENGGVPTGSGTSVNPIFQIGRIIQAGDGDPEIRIMYSDDYAFERTVFEVDRKGIASSVKTGIGSHFEGFKSLTDVNPMFRLNSYPRMRLEMGEGGNSVTDVAVERNALGGLSIFTNNTERVKITSTGATTFTGDISATNLSGTNTGDETTTTIQSKRPLKTIEGQSLEGSGNIDLTKSDVGLSNVDNTSDVNKLVSTATQSALDLKVDKVTGKSLITDTEITRLATLANYTHPANHPPSIISQDASNRFVTDAEKTTWNAKQASLGYTAENAANKNTANGYAGLGSNGKLISSQLPDITISDTFVIASQVAMLAVIAQTGDVAVRTDLNKSFILKANDPTVLANWQELLTPTSAVTTVFGRNGAVTSNTGDYTADQITETATRVFQTPTQRANNDAISSIQTQLNNKQASGTYATGTGSATGTNTGDNATNTQYSGLVSNATHTGDATGATILTLATVNASVGTFGNATNVAQSTVNAKGLTTVIANVPIQIAESQVTGLVTDLALKANDNAVVHLAVAETITGIKTFSSSVSAVTALARGTIISPTLTATANNDTLVGLDIAPTFNNGAFTGFQNISLRVGGNILPSVNNTHTLGSNTNNFSILYVNFLSSNATLITNTGGGNSQLWQTAGVTKIQLFGSTGNLLLQNGGTFTDAGYRLDVNGTARILNTLTSNADIIATTNFTSSSNNIILSDNAGVVFRGVRVNSWSDSVSSRFFQIGTSADNITFTTQSGTAANRMLFSSLQTQISTGNYIGHRVAAGIFEVCNNTTAFLNVFGTGNVTINNTVDSGYRLDVNGTTRLQSTLTLGSVPTTSASTYDVLTRNTSTGVVEKVSNIIPIQLKDFYVDVNNVGIVETDLLTYTTLANRLNAIGEKIVASYAGTFNDATASSQLKVVFGTTVIGDTGALTMSIAGAWIINTSIMRTGATTARSMVNISTPGASTASYTKYTSLAGLTFSNSNIIKITGTASGATGGDNDITASYGNILWQPAAV